MVLYTSSEEMTMNGTSSAKAESNLLGFTAVLTSAACEWFLIFLLLIDAVFSYFLTNFARYCKLEIPCILCSRLEHLLSKEKPASYKNLLCSSHRSEISTLISCQIHGNLVDGRGMCEDCLLSPTTKNKPNPDMHRLFLGGGGLHGLQSQSLRKDLSPASTAARLCSCCNKPWRSRQSVQRLIQLRVPVMSVDRPNIPLPRRSRRESVKKTRDKSPSTSHSVEKNSYDHMSHVGYTELKFTSDSESEFPFSDDDDSNSVLRTKCEPKEESGGKRASKVSFEGSLNDVNSLKRIDCCSKSRTPAINPCMQPDATEFHGVNLAHVDFQQADEQTCPSPMTKTISLDEIPPPSSPAEVSNGTMHSQSSSTSAPIELIISSVDTCPSTDITELPFRESHSVVTQPSDTGGNVGTDTQPEILKSHTIAGTGISQEVNDLKIRDHFYVKPTDPCNSTPNLKESEVFAEPPMKDHDEGLNIMLAQNLSTQGIDAQDQDYDHTPRTGSSSSISILNLQQTDSVERYDTVGFGSLDESTISEIEGENVVEQLKRQVELDKKWLNDLFKELEEERNASAVATNEAMAMITRLQTEKAAIHMEALQYLRMMEEQAEHDADALEKANDLLAEKEKEMQDLEAEIEFYRLNIQDEPMAEAMPQICSGLKEDKITVEKTGINYTNDGDNAPFSLMIPNNYNFSNSSLSEIKDEKLYILERLKSLERKLHEHSGGLCDSNGEAENLKHDHDDERIPVNELSMPKDLPLPSEYHPSNSKLQAVSKGENHVIIPHEQNSSKGDKKIVAVENEIADLHERLEAIEADCDFLERSLNSLENGKDGVVFIQYIAHQLQELRMLGIRRACPSI